MWNSFALLLIRDNQLKRKWRAPRGGSSTYLNNRNSVGREEKWGCACQRTRHTTPPNTCTTRGKTGGEGQQKRKWDVKTTQQIAVQINFHVLPSKTKSLWVPRSLLCGHFVHLLKKKARPTPTDWQLAHGIYYWPPNKNSSRMFSKLLQLYKKINRRGTVPTSLRWLPNNVSLSKSNPTKVILYLQKLKAMPWPSHRKLIWSQKYMVC